MNNLNLDRVCKKNDLKIQRNTTQQGAMGKL